MRQSTDAPTVPASASLRWNIESGILGETLVVPPNLVGDDAVINRASQWIDPYWNAEHLRRTADWLLVLEPGATETLRLAALTHDMERHFPGGPVLDLSLPAGADIVYQREHPERSARIVGQWLCNEGAQAATVTEVERLIRLHEVGGDSDASLLQAADSLSFLEINIDVPYAWARRGDCGLARARAQHTWMFDRIQVPAAREVALPLYEAALHHGDTRAGADVDDVLTGRSRTG